MIFMNPKTSSVLRTVGLGLVDLVMIVVAAIILSVVWVAAWLAIDPVPQNLIMHSAGLVWVAMALLAVLFWLGTDRMPRFKSRPWLRLSGLAAIVGGGAAAWFLVQAILDDYQRGSDADWLSLQLATFLLAIAGLFMVRRDMAVRGWWRLKARLVTGSVLVAILIWMGWDEAPSPSIERNRAVVQAGVNEDEATYQLTLRFTPSPGGAQIYKAPAHSFRFPSKEPALTHYLRAHRTEIESNWAELIAVRTWWAEMAAAPALGDRTTGGTDQPFIRFGPVRGYTENALALARLRALDGDGDGAMAMVEAVYVVGARLGPGARTLVRAMIAIQVQRQAMDAADFVLSQAPVSAETRERFALLLTATQPTAEGARRLVLADSEYTTSMIASFAPSGVLGASGAGGWLRCWELVSAVVRRAAFNPQATNNAMQVQMERLSELAAKRDMKGMDAYVATHQATLFGSLPVKNLSGRLLVVMATPSFGSVVKSYWEIADREKTLVLRLRADH
jgi:hypothetical protein